MLGKPRRGEKDHEPVPHAAGRGKHQRRHHAEAAHQLPKGEQDHEADRREHGARVLAPKLAHLATPRYSRTSNTLFANSGVFMRSMPRGRGRPDSTTASTRPGAVPMTTMRSARNTASAMLCVTKTMVCRRCSQMRSSSTFIRSRVNSSSAPKGS